MNTTEHTDDQPTLIQVMAWCRQTNQYPQAIVDQDQCPVYHEVRYFSWAHSMISTSSVLLSRCAKHHSAINRAITKHDCSGLQLIRKWSCCVTEPLVYTTVAPAEALWMAIVSGIFRQTPQHNWTHVLCECFSGLGRTHFVDVAPALNSRILWMLFRL